MVAFLDEFPIGQVLASGNVPVEYPASSPRENDDFGISPTPASSALAKLANRSLDSDKYLRRLVPEVVTQFDKVRKKTLEMIMMEEGPSYDVPRSNQFWQVTSVHITLNIAYSSSTHDGAVGTGNPKVETLHETRSSTGTKLDNIQQALVVFDNILLFNTILLDLIQISLAKTKQTERNIKKLGQLKKSLVEYSLHIDKILLYYTNTNSALVKELPRFEDVINSKTEIQRLINQMNPEDLHNLIPGDVGILPEYILCSIIGLNNSYGDRLHQLPEEVKSHQSSEYFLKELVEQDYGEYGNLYCSDIDSNRLAEILREIGFIESRSRLLADWIGNLSTDAKEHQPLSYWIHVYIDELFQNDILLNDALSPAYPFKEDQVGEWSSVHINRDDDNSDEEEIENEDCSAPVKIMNTTIANAKSLTRDKVAYPPRNVSGAYWYHGTDAKHAKHILENGIKIGVGKVQQDFSNGHGFYLSPSYECALDWAQHHTNPTVIVFKINPNNIFTSGKYKVLDLCENEADWSKIVHYHRCGETSSICSLSKNLQRSLKLCDGIRGAMCTFRADDKPKRPDWKPRGFGRTESERMQLFIRSDKLAEEFQKLNNIDGAIFLSKKKSA
jgi:hypothetical protein